jgi:hypothetical protein
MKTFCKDCKFIKEPVETTDSIGKTWGPYTCHAPLNMTITQDFLGNDKENFAQSPYERNKEHDCHLYKNALTGEINPAVDPVPVEPQPEVKAEMTSDELSLAITKKKKIFADEVIDQYASMNQIKGYNSTQVIAAAQKFATIQSVLGGRAIGTAYGMVCMLTPDEVVSQLDIDLIKAMMEKFLLEIKPLEIRLDQMLNPPVIVEPETPVTPEGV